MLVYLVVKVGRFRGEVVGGGSCNVSFARGRSLEGVRVISGDSPASGGGEWSGAGFWTGI